MNDIQRSVVYIAVSNLIETCNEALETDDIDTESKETYEALIIISEEVLDIMRKDIIDTDKPISSPQWD